MELHYPMPNFVGQAKGVIINWDDFQAPKNLLGTFLIQGNKRTFAIFIAL